MLNSKIFIPDKYIIKSSNDVWVKKSFCIPPKKCLHHANKRIFSACWLLETCHSKILITFESVILTSSNKQQTQVSATFKENWEKRKYRWHIYSIKISSQTNKKNITSDRQIASKFVANRSLTQNTRFLPFSLLPSTNMDGTFWPLELIPFTSLTIVVEE